MKTAFILFFVLVLFALDSNAAAPYGIKGQNQSTLYSNVHQFPNNQVTNLGGINALVETGNTNILTNPNFAHTSYLTGWDTTGDTSTKTVESTIVISGLNSAKIVASAQAISLKQSSTLYQAQFADGVQGLAMCRIKSNVAVNVCSIQAGTVSTTNCAVSTTDNKWSLIKVPFILGATSNGVSIASTGNVTGTVYVDDCFVGAADIKQDVPTCTTTACAIEVTASIVGSTGAITTQTISGTLTNVRNSAGLHTITYSSLGLTVVPSVSLMSTCQQNFINVAPTTTSVQILTRNSAGTATDCDFSVYVTKNGADASSAQRAISGGVYTATCGANCEETFSARVTAAGVVTSESTNFINGNCALTATSNYSCSFNSGIFTVPPSCTITQEENTGGTIIFNNMINPTSGAVLAVLYTGGSRGAYAFNLICQKQGADFVATRNIIGSFSETVTTKGVSKPSISSASVSASEVITEDDSLFLSSCTNADPSVCTLTTSFFTADPKCWANPIVAGTISAVTGDTTTTVTVDRTDASTAFTLFCHGAR